MSERDSAGRGTGVQQRLLWGGDRNGALKIEQEKALTVSENDRMPGQRPWGRVVTVQRRATHLSAC